MVRRRNEAHLALDNLAEYRNRLDRRVDAPLISALTRLMNVFQSRLFLALLDIQEFYESTLLDPEKNSDEKTAAALDVALRWENISSPSLVTSAIDLRRVNSSSELNSMDRAKSLFQLNLADPRNYDGRPPFGLTETLGKEHRDYHNCQACASGIFHPTDSTSSCSVPNYTPSNESAYQHTAASNRLADSAVFSSADADAYGDSTSGCGSPQTPTGDHPVARPRHQRLKRTKSTADAKQCKTRTEYEDSPQPAQQPELTEHTTSIQSDRRPINRWSALSRLPITTEVILDRTPQGFGFSIAGGRSDSGSGSTPGSEIVVTKISPGGAAECEGSLQPGDCILSVNGISLLGVTHEEAVRTLQSAGPRLKLVIERGYRTSDMTNSSSFLLDSPHFHSRLGHVPPSHPRLTHEPNDRQMPHRPTGPGTTVEDGKCGSVAVTSSSLVSGSSIEPQSSGSRSEAVTYNGMSERVKRREQRPMKVKTDQNKPRDSSQAASKHDTENKGTSPSARPTTVSRRLKKSAPTSFPAFSWCAGLQKTNGCSALLTSTNRHSSASQHRLSSRRRGEAGKSRSQSSIVQISSKSSRPLPAPKPGPVVVEVILTRGTRSGLGFSIAGGVNNEAVDGDPGIFITKMTPGGVADTDGRLHVGDRIVQVNGISLVEVSHEQAVNALKQAGDRVQMIVVKQPGVKMAKTSRAIKTESVVRQQLPHSNSCDTISNQVTSPDSARLSGAPIHNHRLRRSSSSSSAELDKQAEYLEQPTAKSQGGGDGHCQGLLEAQMSGLIDYAAAASVSDLVSRWPNARLVTVFRSGRSVGTTSPAHPVSHSPNKRHRSQSVGGNLGLHIVGGDGSEATFISYVHPTKPAGASKRLFVGDRVLAVNGIDVTEYGHEQAAAALRNAPDRVDLVLAYCPEEYAEFERCYARQLRAVGHKLSHQTAKRLQTELDGTRPGKQRHRKRSTGESKSFTHRVQHTESTPTSSPSGSKELFLRCQVDYDPLKDSHQAAPKKAFTLRSGDLICVTNQTDPEWWQAQRLNPTANEPIGPVGLVPSKARLERRERLRTRHVNFFARTRRPSTSGSTTHSQGGGLDAEEHATNQRLGFSLTDKKKERHRRKDSDTSDSFVLSYIPVTAVQLSFARPVVILGSMKDRISDDLLNEYPDRFGTAVPHTTRSSRPNEVEGRDYHFVLSREIMVADIAAQRYLEAGEYKGNLYGTHLESVFEVAELGLHCLLDVGGPALRRLEAAGLPSIAVLILPEVFPPQNSGSQVDVKKPFEEQSQLLGSSDSASSLNAQTKISRLLRHFSGYLTAIITTDDFEVAYQRVKEVIDENSGALVWLNTP